MATKALYAGSFDPVTLGHLGSYRKSGKHFRRSCGRSGCKPGKAHFFYI